MSYSFTTLDLSSMTPVRRALYGLDGTPDVWLEVARNIDNGIAFLQSKGEWEMVLGDALAEMKQLSGSEPNQETPLELRELPPEGRVIMASMPVSRSHIRTAREADDPLDKLRAFDRTDPYDADTTGPPTVLANTLEWLRDHTF